MKKTLMTLAAVLCCASLFTSCQKGNNASSEENKPDNTPAFVELGISMPATQDMLSYANTVLFYNDGTGEKKETLSSTSWAKTLKVALPCNISFGRTITVKDGVELTKDKQFSYSSGCYVTYNILNSAGAKVKAGGTSGSTSTASLTADKVATLIEKGSLNETHSYSFDKDGNVK